MKKNIPMDVDLVKSYDRSRALLFGLLQFCLLDGNALETCPFESLRNSLTLEEKYRYVMDLSDEEVNKILEQHDACFNKRISGSLKG